MTESRSEEDIGFNEEMGNMVDDVSSEGTSPESPTAQAVAKAFLESVDKYVEYDLSGGKKINLEYTNKTDQKHSESTFSPKNGMSGVVYLGQNGNYHHNSNGHPPSSLIEDEVESDENLQVEKYLIRKFQVLVSIFFIFVNKPVKFVIFFFQIQNTK